MGTLDEIAHIHYKGLSDEFGEIGLGVNISYEHLRKKWEGYEDYVRTHKRDNRVIGFAGNIDGSLMIYVDPDYQRMGIGKRLLNEIDLPWLDIWVMKGNTKAENFYKKNGFNPADSRETTKLGHDITEIKWVRE